jgi:hypothetical protein
MRAMEPGRPRPESNYPWRRSLSVIKFFGDLFNGVPIAVGGGHAEKFLDLSEVGDRLHLPAIQPGFERTDREG